MWRLNGEHEFLMKALWLLVVHTNPYGNCTNGTFTIFMLYSQCTMLHSQCTMVHSQCTMVHFELTPFLLLYVEAKNRTAKVYNYSF